MNFDLSKLSKTEINDKITSINDQINTASSKLRIAESELKVLEKKRRPKLKKIRILEDDIEFYSMVLRHLKSYNLIMVDAHNDKLKENAPCNAPSN